jgi:hypothetical protein
MKLTDKYTDNEIWNAVTTIVFTDEETNRMLELVKANDHARIGALVIEYVDKDIQECRARLIKTLKEVLGAGL